MESITREQWDEYRSVQDSGADNMYDPNAREMTDISRQDWIVIMKYYSELKKKYEGDK